mgnify:CR=1 FL=1
MTDIIYRFRISDSRLQDLIDFSRPRGYNGHGYIADIPQGGILMMSQSKNFALLTGSTLLIAIGTYFFKFTNNFTFGGITGLAVLVAKSGFISAGDFNFIVNMLLLLLGFLILGKKFCREDCLLQHPALRGPVASGTDLPHERPSHGPAYAGAGLCHRAPGPGIRSPL